MMTLNFWFDFTLYTHHTFYHARGHTKTIELNQEELTQVIDKINSLKKEMEDYSEDK